MLWRAAVLIWWPKVGVGCLPGERAGMLETWATVGRAWCLGGDRACEAMQKGGRRAERPHEGKEKRRMASGLLGGHWAFAEESKPAWEKETVQAKGPGLGWAAFLAENWAAVQASLGLNLVP